MAGFDGAGNYILRYNFVTDASLGIKILASKQDAMWSDVATGFGNCLTRDGQGRPTADLNWNAKRLTNLGAATGATDAAQLQQVQSISVKGGQNIIVNPAFSVWQRGSPITVGAGAYTADHWYCFRTGSVAGATAKSNFGDTGNPFATSIGYGRAVGDASAATTFLRSCIETIDAGKISDCQAAISGTVTIISCYMKAGTTLPASTITFSLYGSNTNDAGPLNGGWTSQGSTSFSSTTLTTTTYTRISYVFTTNFLNPNSIMLDLSLANTAGVAGADDLLYVTGVKIEQFVGSASSSPTAFEAPPYQIDLGRCQRYYRLLGQGGGTSIVRLASYDSAAAVNDHYVPISPQMFTTPTPTKNGTWTVSNCSQPSCVAFGPDGVCLRTTVTALGHFSYNTDSSDDYISLLAELTA